MILLKSSSTFDKKVTDRIKEGSVAAAAEKLLNLNLFFWYKSVNKMYCISLPITLSKVS